MKRIIAGLAATFLVAGCATMQTDTSHDPEASFAGFETYAWMPDRPPDAATGRAFLQRMITNAVDGELGAAGFTRAEEAEADFWVNYHLASEGGLEVRKTYDPYGTVTGFGPDVWNNTRETTYVEGSLILDVVEPGTRRLLWRGVAREAVPAAPEEAQRAIADAADRLLGDFPPSES